MHVPSLSKANVHYSIRYKANYHYYYIVKLYTLLIITYLSILISCFGVFRGFEHDFSIFSYFYFSSN